MQAVKKMMVGILISLSVAAVADTGFFDEAAQYQVSKTAWCGSTCK